MSGSRRLADVDGLMSCPGDGDRFREAVCIVSAISIAAFAIVLQEMADIELLWIYSVCTEYSVRSTVRTEPAYSYQYQYVRRSPYFARTSTPYSTYVRYVTGRRIDSASRNRTTAKCYSDSA